ncbi:NFACT family protein [bacterium]|nr:NFACT family protein [bacterium]
MFSNWLTYRAVAQRLDDALKGAVIMAAFTQQKNELVLVTRRGEDETVLQFSAEPHFAWLLLKPEFARARKNSLDLFPDLAGDRIESVRIAKDDRIVRIALASGRALYAFLFSMRANMLLTDADGTLLDSFKQHAAPANYAETAYSNALPEFSDMDVVSAFSSAGEKAVRDALRHLRPWLAGALAEEICFRAECTLTQPVADLAQEKRTAITAVLNEVLRASDGGTGYVYLRDGAAAHAAPFQLRHLEEEGFEEIASPLLDALFLYLRKRFSGGELAAVRKRVGDRIERELQRLERSLGKLSNPDTLRLQADEYEKFGNLLMIHLYDQPEQPGRITVPDVFTDPRLVVSIPLKGRTTVLENSQRYFGKAQQTRASISYVKERAASLRYRIEVLSMLRDSVRDSEHLNELKTLFKQQAKLMNELGMTQKGEKDESPFPFRRFVVEGGFEVWAGKNSANNDLLTVRHSRPNDLWFHARGVGGSHVVLKVGSAAGDPSKQAIRQAAAIAAYYSKHRNAKRVPVAYTEKKYVRKPKGANPGSVLVDREKVLLIDPALPEGADNDD